MYNERSEDERTTKDERNDPVIRAVLLIVSPVFHSQTSVPACTCVYVYGQARVCMCVRASTYRIHALSCTCVQNVFTLMIVGVRQCEWVMHVCTFVAVPKLGDDSSFIVRFSLSSSVLVSLTHSLCSLSILKRRQTKQTYRRNGAFWLADLRVVSRAKRGRLFSFWRVLTHENPERKPKSATRSLIRHRHHSPDSRWFADTDWVRFLRSYKNTISSKMRRNFHFDSLRQRVPCKDYSFLLLLTNYNSNRTNRRSSVSTLFSTSEEQKKGDNYWGTTFLDAISYFLGR